MSTDRRRAFAALTVAGRAVGDDRADVQGRAGLPRSGLAGVLPVLPGRAAACSLVVSRPQLRAVLRPTIVVWGAVGYGGSILVQNIGVGHTSVTHAALLVGMTPILVAAGAAAWSRSELERLRVGRAAVLRRRGRPGGEWARVGSSLFGDALVLVSLVFACSFTVAQGYLLPGRDPVAVTAVQLVAASMALLPIAMLAEGVPSDRRCCRGVAGSTVGLAILGTLAPFVLFAYRAGHRAVADRGRLHQHRAPRRRRDWRGADGRDLRLGLVPGGGRDPRWSGTVNSSRSSSPRRGPRTSRRHHHSTGSPRQPATLSWPRSSLSAHS